MAKRDVDLVIISDIHLGTYGCHAKELLRYLKSIRPQKLILNGDIIDIWQFSKSYWPETHMKVLRRIMKFIVEGVEVTYLTGNHDEMLRKFADFDLGTFQLKNKTLLELDGKMAWIFHGDVFDVTMQHSKWLAKLGAIGYDTLILLNSFVNWGLTRFGYEKMSFSQKVKGKFKDAVKFINQFEQTAADLAIRKKYDYVVCGHIHKAEIREIEGQELPGKVLYLNSGDWVESLTALEYYEGKWDIYRYLPEHYADETEEEDSTDTADLKAMMDVNQLLLQFKQG